MNRLSKPSKPPVCIEVAGVAEPVSRSAARMVRALGWELHRLRGGARLLAARVRNGTLPAPLIEFLTPVLSPSDDDHVQPASFSVRVMIREKEVRVLWDSLDGCGIPAELLALLHLSALGGFWERALRRSHYHRLQRLLPRAWFVMADPPPVGAVAPGFGIDAGDGPRVPFSSGEIVIEETPADDALPLVAHYERKDGRMDFCAGP